MAAKKKPAKAKARATDAPKKRVGRPPGSPNKTTKEVKEALQTAFESLGGIPGLIKWAKKDIPIIKNGVIVAYTQANLTEFYKMWAKLLPVELKGTTPDGRIHLHITSTDAEL